MRKAYFIFVLTRVFAIFQLSCTIKASLQIFWNSIGSLSQTLNCAQLTEYLTQYKCLPFFLLNFLRKFSRHSYQICLLSLHRISFFKDSSCLEISYMQYCTLMNNTQGLFSVGHGKHFEKVRQVDKLNNFMRNHVFGNFNQAQLSYID